MRSKTKAKQAKRTYKIDIKNFVSLKPYKNGPW